MQIDPSRIPWQPTRRPGLSLFTLYQEPSSNDAVVLIRMEPGTGYPRHRHVGEERVLVLHGGYRDESGTYPPGTWVVNPAGSIHTPVALDGAEPCVLLATALRGIEIVEDA